MIKKYILTFSISVLVLFSVCIIMLMIMLPQQPLTNGTVKTYERANLNEYTFERTKDISKESLIREYRITDEDLLKFQIQSQYKSGNADPFTPAADLKKEEENNDKAKTDEKTTNKNDGTPVPPADDK